MINLSQWQRQHGITNDAMTDLVTILCAPADIATDGNGSAISETAAQQQIRLDAPRHGVRLWRNNVGATMDDNGNFIRFGLMNETGAMNKKLKSPDLVGITPVIIEPRHVGQTLGIFTAVEVKRPGWVFKGTAHENAQLAACQLIISLGGFATFATCPEDVWPRR